MIDGEKLTARAAEDSFLRPPEGRYFDLQGDARSEVLKTLSTLRQQILKPSGQHHHALADYGTGGLRLEGLCRFWRSDHRAWPGRMGYDL